MELLLIVLYKTGLKKNLTERTGVRTRSICKMEGVLDEDQRLDEGRVEAEDGKLNYEDFSDDEEVKLLPHQKGADEPDPPGADIRDVPEESGTQQEEWLLTMEPLNGARPKWNRVGQPPVVPEQTRGVDAEASGGIVDLNIEHRGALAPLLPLDRQNMQEAEVVTPLRKEANVYGGLRAPESQLPPRGTGVPPQIFTDARTRDVISDRRNVAWSPENILIDTVARLQQDLADIRAESRQLGTTGSHMWCTPLARWLLRQPKCHGLEERPVGSSTGKYLMP